MARLAAGATVADAAVEARGIAAQLPSGNLDGTWRNSLNPVLSPLHDRVSGAARRALSLVGLATVCLLLLIAANVGSLLLTKGAARRREMAVRAALGAGRAQLVRQLFVEHALLTSAAAAAGLALAFLAASAIARIEGTAIPLLSQIKVDAAALAFTAGLAILTGVAVGLLPAWQVSDVTPNEVLVEGARGSSARISQLRRVLVAAEFAIVLVMLSAGGLLARSVLNILAVPAGFDAGDLVTVRIDPGPAFRTIARRTPYFGDMLAAAASLPEVESAGLTDALPLGNNFGWRRWNASTSGTDRVKAEPLIRMIDPGYFATMKIRMVEGRTFGAGDDSAAEPVAIVNEALARVLWPDGAAVGRVLKTAGVERRVVGIVAEARYFSLEERSGPELYMPIAQTGDFRVVNLVVRTHADPTAIGPALRSALARVDPTLPLEQVRAMSALVDDSLFARRSVAWLVSAFAVFGLILAAVGLYAVIALAVRQRRQEIGIRIALGASPETVGKAVLKDTMALAAMGALAGVPLAALIGRAMRGLLFDVSASDPVTLIGVLAVLAAVAVTAGAVPARRAARTDAADVLRS